MPTRLDDRQEELLRELAELRGEEKPEGTRRRRQAGSSPGCATPSGTDGGSRCRCPCTGSPTLAGVRVGEVVEVTGAEGRHAVAVRRLAGRRAGRPHRRSRPGRLRAWSPAPASGSLAVTVAALEQTAAPSPRVHRRAGHPEGRPRRARGRGADRGRGRRRRAVGGGPLRRGLEGRAGGQVAAKWVATAAEAAKQAHRTWLPEVRELATTAQVATCSPGWARGLAVVLHEEADEPLAGAAATPTARRRAGGRPGGRDRARRAGGVRPTPVRGSARLGPRCCAPRPPGSPRWRR